MRARGTDRNVDHPGRLLDRQVLIEEQRRGIERGGGQRFAGAAWRTNGNEEVACSLLRQDDKASIEPAGRTTGDICLGRACMDTAVRLRLSL